MFLFAIYAGGLRFGDVLELQFKHYSFEENKIKKTISKSSNRTKQEHLFKIGKISAEIIEKYRKDFTNNEDFIFPVIKEKQRAAYFSDLEKRDILKNTANKIIGTKLKKIGKDLKFDFPLTFHLSRHTFATNCLNNGMRIEHVSKLMGHEDIKTTQIYAKILNSELDKSVDDFVY